MKAPIAIHRSTAPSTEARLQTIAAERAVDAVLEGSFPASDPPSWTLGITRPRPQRPANLQAVVPDASRTALTKKDVMDLSRPATGRGTFVRAAMSWAGAVGIALIAPVIVLLIGLPVVLAVRGIVTAVNWLLAMTS